MSEDINIVYIKHRHDIGYEFMFQSGSDLVQIQWKTVGQKTSSDICLALRNFEIEAKRCFDNKKMDKSK